MSEQMSLDLPARHASGREDFFVTDSNAVALAMLDNWRDWPLGKLVLTGPHGSGKTHLAHVWAAETGAQIIAAAALEEAGVPDLASGPICVEDVGQIAQDHARQTTLFHLHNMARAQGQPLLLTDVDPPSHWALGLADLQSRMQGTQVAHLGPPDDMLLSIVLAKLFADKLTVPAPGVIPYLVKRMPRSFAVAGHLVDEIDRRALGTRKGANLACAKAALTALDDRDPDLSQ